MDFTNLEQAIQILTDPMTHQDQEVKKQANDYLLSLVSANYTDWRSYFEYFAQTQNESTKYWLLQALWDIVKEYWSELSNSEQKNFANAALEFIKINHALIIPINHYWMKYSVMYTQIIKHSYPHQLNTFFDDLIGLVKQSEDSLSFLKFTFWVLENINDDIIEREAWTKNEDIAIANRVKDGMRENDVKNIVGLCQTVLDNYESLDKVIVVGAIDTLADLIDWNELTLFESSFDKITKLLDSKEYQQNALYWFYSFMHKGMDSGVKIQLIRDLNIIEKIKSFDIDRDDFELCQSISDIISRLGMLIYEIIETSEQNAPYMSKAQLLVFDLLVLNIMFLEWEDIKSSQYIVKFVNAMVLYFKRFPELSDDLNEILVKIQDVCIQKIEYPDWCTFEDGKLGEDEENFKVLRVDLWNLFVNTLLIPSLKARALEITEQKLISLKGNIHNFTENQVELPMFLLTQMHALICRDDKDLVSPQYQKLISQFISVNFIEANSKIVSIMYFEIWVKFASYFVHFPEAIPIFLENIMGNKGILSPWSKLASRSSFFLLRFIDRLKPQLAPWAELIFEKAQEVIKLFESGGSQLDTNDIENIYEIIGSMLNGYNMPPDKIKDTLSHYFGLIYTKMVNMSSPHIDGYVELIRRLNFLIKSLSVQNASESKELFVEMSSNLYSVFEQYITSPIQEWTVFVQKSLVLSGVLMTDIAKQYVECLLKVDNMECLDSWIRLVNFIAIEWDEIGLQLIEAYIPVIFVQLEKIEFPKDNKADLDKDKISLYSKFSKLISTGVQKNSLVFISLNWKDIFENLIKFLSFMVGQNVDKNLKKEALIILRTMLVEYSGCKINQIVSTHLGNKSKIEDHKISDNSEYESMYLYFINSLSETTFEAFKVLDTSDPVDINCVYLISLIHVVLINTIPDFTLHYQNRIIEIKPDINFEELAKNIELIISDKMKVGVFKRNITKLFRPSK